MFDLATFVANVLNLSGGFCSFRLLRSGQVWRDKRAQDSRPFLFERKVSWARLSRQTCPLFSRV